MNKESFVKVFNEIEKLEEIYEHLYSFNIDITESDLYTIPHTIFEEYITSNFPEEETQDFIFWWMYEASRKVLEDEKGEVVDITTPEKLWDYLVSDGAISDNS